MTMTVGRIVHVFEAPADGANPNAWGDPQAAVVTAVHGADCVNLKIFRDNGPVDSRTSVLQRGSAGAEGMVWDWPERA